jgi:hypothetical protein
VCVRERERERERERGYVHASALIHTLASIHPFIHIFSVITWIHVSYEEEDTSVI